MSLNIPNLERLISHLEGLPESQFSIKHLVEYKTECGTVGCIAGWCNILRGEVWDAGPEAAQWLGLPEWKPLFTPLGFFDHPELYPLSRAIRTLKHMRSEYLRTGQVVVDWDAPEPADKPAWTAPRATERTLPEEIVSLLRPAQRTEVSA